MDKTVLFSALFALSFAFAQEGAMLEIVTNPAEASIYINKEKVGVSPAAYQFTIPGAIVISLQKENYEPLDTTLIIQMGQNYKIDVTLKENFQKILAQDTTVEGYLLRKGRVQAKIEQIDNEMNAVLANEAVDYENKVAAHQKYTAYRNELLQAIGILDNNINIAKAEALKMDLAKEAAVAATKPAEASSSSSGGLGWRGWTRILTFTAAAVCGAVAVAKHLKVKDFEKDINDLNANPSSGGYGEYEKNYNSINDNVKENELHRNIFSAGAGVFAVAGTLTFFF